MAPPVIIIDQSVVLLILSLNMKQTNTQSPKRAYQVIFAIFTLAYVVNLIWSVWLIYTAYQFQPQMSQLSFVMGIGAILPLLLFVVSFAVIKGDMWLRLYRSSLLTLGAMLVVWAVKTLAYLSSYFLMDLNSLLWILKLEVLPMLVGLIPFILVVLRIQRQSIKKVEQTEKGLLIWGALTLLVVNVVQQVYFAGTQSLFNSALALVSMVGLCMLLFLPAYLLEKGRSRFERTFRGVLVSVVVILFWASVLQTIGSIFPQVNDAPESSLLMAAFTTLVVGLVVVSYVYIRRRVRTLP